MIQHELTAIRLAVLLCAGLLVPSLPAAEPILASATGPEGQTGDLHPFTHLAYIPANSELRTIRFERIKKVKVPASVKHRAEANYCAEIAFKDPGGSMSCSNTGTVVSAVAYEVAYSYIGQPMASDESANRHFEFKVYFRSNELPPEVLQAVSARKLDRADTAAYFAVNTYRETGRQVVIDSARSSFCPGAYRDGVWTHTDESCHDDIHYTAITTPSDYIAVRVDAVPMSAKRAATGVANTKRLVDPAPGQ
jgi:hypothetical protein